MRPWRHSRTTPGHTRHSRTCTYTLHPTSQDCHHTQAAAALHQGHPAQGQSPRGRSAVRAWDQWLWTSTRRHPPRHHRRPCQHRTRHRHRRSLQQRRPTHLNAQAAARHQHHMQRPKRRLHLRHRFPRRSHRHRYRWRRSPRSRRRHYNPGPHRALHRSEPGASQSHAYTLGSRDLSHKRLWPLCLHRQRLHPPHPKQRLL